MFAHTYSTQHLMFFRTQGAGETLLNEDFHVIHAHFSRHSVEGLLMVWTGSTWREVWRWWVRLSGCGVGGARLSGCGVGGARLSGCYLGGARMGGCV